MGQAAAKPPLVRSAAWTLLCLLIGAMGLLPGPRAHAATQLLARSIAVSDPDASVSDVTYGLLFETGTSGVLGSIRVQFCANSSIIDDICDVPVGFAIDGATLASQNGATGFAISPASTANELILTRPPALQPADALGYELTHVANPASGGSYFARIQTYPTSNASGPAMHSGGVALYFNPSLGISTEVPPHLTFCVGGAIADFDCTKTTTPFTDLGVLESQASSLAQSQMLVATNAEGGYTTWVFGSTMTSGNNELPAMTGQAAQAGVSQFGINLRANTSPIVGQDAVGPGLARPSTPYGTPNQFRFKSGDVLASTAAPDDFRKYTVSYVVNVKKDQPGGVYSTTLTYLTLANF